MGNYMGEHTNSRLIRSLSQEHPSACSATISSIPTEQPPQQGKDGSLVTAWKLHLKDLGCSKSFTSSHSLWGIVLGADRRLGCVQVIFLIKPFVTHFDVPIFKDKKSNP